MTTLVERLFDQSLSSLPALGKCIGIYQYNFCTFAKYAKYFIFISKKLLQTSSQVYSGTVQISNTGFSGSLKNIMRLLRIGLFQNKGYLQSVGQI